MAPGCPPATGKTRTRVRANHAVNHVERASERASERTSELPTCALSKAAWNCALLEMVYTYVWWDVLRR